VKDADGTQKSVVVVDVEPSEQVHANQKDEVYLRVGDENRKLRYREREELLFDKGQATFETRLLEDFDPRDSDEELLASYADAVGHPDAIRILSARGLTKGEAWTAAAVLLFAQQPQVHFPEARIRILSYGASERGTGKRQQLREEVTLDGPIPRALLAAQAEMRRMVPTRRALGQNGRFEEVPIIPEDAWLEGIVNAAVHRSYSLAGDHVRVEVFPERIEIESPGRAPGLVRLSDPLNSNRFARNPRIARVCADLNFGQELGEGIRRMFDEMRLAGLTPPHYQETAGSVRLILAALPAEPALEDLRSEYAEIVRLLRMEGPKSSGEIASHMEISRPTLIRWMKELEALSLVRWKGSSSRDPTAVWVARRLN
jgi:ATP-dependent DNA helicase RecG